MVNQSQSNHIDEEILERYALGKLGEEDVAPLEEHLFVCHACQDRLDDTDAFVSAFRTAIQEVPAGAAQERWYQRFFRIPKVAWVPALAAAAVLAIVVQTTPTIDKPQLVQLRTYRGAEVGGEVAAGSPLDLRLGSENLKRGLPYRVEIVDSRGARVWYGVASWDEDVAGVHVSKVLGAGKYWVRLYEVAPDSELVREYGLTVR
jgi:hypothetical protein